MNEINDSSSHQFDGVDRDDVKNHIEPPSPAPIV